MCQKANQLGCRGGRHVDGCALLVSFPTTLLCWGFPLDASPASLLYPFVSRIIAGLWCDLCPLDILDTNGLSQKPTKGWKFCSGGRAAQKCKRCCSWGHEIQKGLANCVFVLFFPPDPYVASSRSEVKPKGKPSRPLLNGWRGS